MLQVSWNRKVSRRQIAQFHSPNIEHEIQFFRTKSILVFRVKVWKQTSEDELKKLVVMFLMKFSMKTK